MIALDLCQPYYQNLLHIYQKKIHTDKDIVCESHLDDMSIKDDQLIFRCFERKNNYKKRFKKYLIKRFASKYEFWNGEINKFILSLRKGIYPYEDKDSCERFDEASLHYKEPFYSNLNIKDIKDVDYRYALRVKHLGKYHDLHVQNDTLLLADVFGNIKSTLELKFST